LSIQRSRRTVLSAVVGIAYRPLERPLTDSMSARATLAASPDVPGRDTPEREAREEWVFFPEVADPDALPETLAAPGVVPEVVAVPGVVLEVVAGGTAACLSGATRLACSAETRNVACGVEGAWQANTMHRTPTPIAVEAPNVRCRTLPSRR
jgi:hypothetical protein